jgi:hypothetical protein
MEVIISWMPFRGGYISDRVFFTQAALFDLYTYCPGRSPLRTTPEGLTASQDVRVKAEAGPKEKSLEATTI